MKSLTVLHMYIYIYTYMVRLICVNKNQNKFRELESYLRLRGWSNLFSSDINVCVGVIVNGVVSPTKCPESLL